MIGQSNKEKELSLVLVIALTLPVTKYCIVQSVPGLHEYNGIANILIAGLVLLLMIPLLPTLISRSASELLFVFTVLTLYIFANYLAYPANRQNIQSHLFRIYAISYGSFCLSVSIRNFELFLRYLYKASYIMITSGIFMFVTTSFIWTTDRLMPEYNLSLSYYLVVPSITLLLAFRENKKLVQFIFFVIGIFIIIAMGSRGPILCVLVFYLLYLAKFGKFSWNRLPRQLGLSASFLLLFLLRKEIANTAYNILERFNLHSRTLRLFLVGEISSPSGRGEILKRVGEKIAGDPLFGIGFLGDLWSHNLLFEVLLFNGVFFGSILLAGLGYFSIQSLRYQKDKSLSLLILIFFAHAIPDALLNLTIWGKDMFWIFLGFGYTATRAKFDMDGVNLKMRDIS